MKQTDILEHLHLSLENQTRLLQQIKLFEYSKRGIVIHKGQAVSGAFMVLAGKLRVFTYSPDGPEATLYTLGPGDTCVLTLNCLFNQLRYPAWVQASNNSAAALIPGDLYRDLFAEEESIRDITIEGLSTLVFRLMDELEEVHSCTLEQRLVRFLLNNASTDGWVHITQQELANHMGSSREVIARIAKGLSQQGLISTNRGKIHLINAEALARHTAP